MTVLAIDAGHYRNTPGRRCPGYLDPEETREWELNRRVADRLVSILGRYDCTVFRVDDVTGNTLISLEDRVAQANRRNADFYLSIHHNAGIGGGTGGGIVVYVAPGCQERSREFQQGIYEAAIQATGLRGNRSTPMAEKGLYVLRRTGMPAVLIECGFMDSASDAPVILNREFAGKLADALANYIVKEFHLTQKKGMGILSYWCTDGVHIVETPAEELSVELVDRGKRDCGGSYCSGGFFGRFREGTERFTLPAGHLACRFAARSRWTRFYCARRGKLTGSRLIMDGGRTLTTLRVVDGEAEVGEYSRTEEDWDWAISGVPVIRDGQRVPWTQAQAQGWEKSSLYNTWHTFLCLKDDPGVVYAAAFKSREGNLIDSGEGWRRLSALGFTQAVMLDGGGSFHLALDGRTVASSWGNRRICTILRFGSCLWPVPRRTLTKGKRGNDVKWLQWELSRRGFPCAVDGSFGPATEKALRDFQHHAGLAVDGSCGPATRNALEAK